MSLSATADTSEKQLFTEDKESDDSLDSRVLLIIIQCNHEKTVAELAENSQI